MAPRIVSWSNREICISPVRSSAASIISFDSTFSDSIPSPIGSEVLGLPSDKFGAGYSNLPGLSDEGRTPRSGHATLDDSFVRHDAYFFKDGNVTFLIDGTLYCVHRYFFSRDSIYFSTRFSRLDIRDHEALPIVISIGDVKRGDFEALLSVLYPANFEAHELSYKQWKSVLHLSTRWDFASLRKLALKSIRPPTSHDQLVLARTYSVEEWVLPALTALCSRALPLSLDEARQMDIEDVILVASVREEIRGGALRVDTADIPQYVEMAQASRLVSKVYSDKLESGSTGQESGSTMDPVSKLVNASTTGLLGDGLNVNGHAPAESGKLQLPPMGEALQAEKLGNPPEDTHTREHLTVMTEVPVAAHMATAGPTTPGPTMPRPTNAGPTTPGPRPTTPRPTMPELTMPRQTTPWPTTAGPTTSGPITPGPIMPGPTVPRLTMPRLTTPWPTTAGPTTPGPTTPQPTTTGLTMPGSTTPGPIMPGPTTPGLTMPRPTTPWPTTAGSTTSGPTTPGLTTPGPSMPGSTMPRLTMPQPTTPWPTTAGPTTPEPTTPGGGCNDGEDGEGGEKVLEDDQITPAPEDDWGIPLKTKKKKKGGASALPPVAPCASCIAGGCSCTTMKKKKKKKEVANVGTPVVLSTGGGVVDGA